ncbi:MAG: AAA family ATPase [Gemmatimonadaceae bacterium]|nr:AAA family ATPase [Gemmatimonadaceae bacterium]
MIRRVKIQNFRSIEDLEFFPTQCCALIGENSSGKTNILRAIKMVLEKEWHRVTDFSPEDVIDGSLDKDVLIEVEFDPPPTFVAFKNVAPVPIPVLRFDLTRYKINTANAEKGDLRLEGTPLTAKGKPVQILAKAPRKGQPPEFRPLTNIPPGLKAQVPVIYVPADRRLESQMPSSRYSLLRRLFEDIDEIVKKRKAAAPNAGRTIAEVFAEKVLEAVQVLRIPEFVLLENLLQRHSVENLGWDPEIDLERFSVHFGLQDPMDFFKAIRLMVKDGPYELDAVDLGDGAQNALVVAIFQAYESLKRAGAVFLVEEPEMYLHPHRCRLFYSTLRHVAESNQVIYSTHSPYFVAIPEYEEIRVVSRNAASRTQVRGSTLAGTAELREKLRKEFDPERNELFFAKHVDSGGG